MIYLKRWYLSSLIWYESKFLNKYFLSIDDIPVYNWNKFHDTEDPRYLSRTGKVCKRAVSVYQMLKDQLVDRFGIPEDYLRIIQNKIQIELYYGIQIQSGDKSNQIFIDVLEFENKQLQEQSSGKTDLMQAMLGIEKFMGGFRDPKVISVAQFYNYIKFVNENIKTNVSK